MIAMVTRGRMLELMNGITQIEFLRSSNNYGEDTSLVHEEFKNYFNNEGAVSWQWALSEKQYDQLNAALVFMFTLQQLHSRQG